MIHGLHKEIIMAITKVTGDVLDVQSVSATLATAYSMRIFVDTGDSNKTKLQLISVTGGTTTIVSSILLTELYASLGEVGRT